MTGTENWFCGEILLFIFCPSLLSVCDILFLDLLELIIKFSSNVTNTFICSRHL